MYSNTYFLLSSVLGVLSMSTAAQAAQVDCVLEVGGRAYISGECTFKRLSRADGSFRINALDDQYFAYVYVKPEGTAEAYWNENPEYRNAQSPHGALQRDGACWVSEAARICAVEKTSSSAAGAHPAHGKWDCEGMIVTLDADRYNDARVQSIETIADSDYGLTLADGTLAGADIAMADAVRHCHHRLGLPLDQVLRLASAHPAAALGLRDRGHLRPGARADFIRLDDALQLQGSWIAGKAVPASPTTLSAGAPL